MSKKERQDSTEQLIAEGEVMRGDKRGGKRAPATRALVRDAERLIGRQPVAPGVRRMLVGAVILAAVAAGLAGLYLLFA